MNLHKMRPANKEHPLFHIIITLSQLLPGPGGPQAGPRREVVGPGRGGSGEGGEIGKGGTLGLNTR